MKLSVVILTNKETKKILTAVESVRFADEIIVIIDSHTLGANKSDSSVRYFNRPLVGDFATQRNFGLTKAKGDWVLFVDDDEVVSPALAQEIKMAIHHPQYNAYRLKRRDRYFAQVLRYGETGNTKIIRLARRGAGSFVRAVHETWQVKGPVGELTNPLTHHRKELVTPFINRMSFYGPLDAKALADEGKTFSILRLLLNPLAKFIYNYKIRLGFLDGYLGLFQAYLMSMQSLSVRIFQWQSKS